MVCFIPAKIILAITIIFRMNMERIVAKFGGSSLANANQLKKVRAILEKDPRRRIVVVSAPGKRSADDVKLTDLLYLCHEMVAMGTSIEEPFQIIRSRFAEMAEELALSKNILTDIDHLGDELVSRCSRDYTASRGEYFSARLIAEYLDAAFIDPADHITIKANGTIAPESYVHLGKALKDANQLYVMAGFYGKDQDGNVKTFSRGGSDISGAVAARAASALLYENWTDTSGILMADPRIVKNPRPMAEISFRELREMSYMGASVFHDEAILPVREVDIPIRIRNTNRPEDQGTLITATLSEQIIATTQIAGIAGKKEFAIISLEKSLMNREVGFVHRLLGTLREHGISFEHCPSSIDSVSVIIDQNQLAGGKEELLKEAILRQLEPDHHSIEKDIALIAVVGEKMADSIGIAGKLFNALAEAKVNVRVINQGASEMNIIIGVDGKDYESAVRSIYSAFVPK